MSDEDTAAIREMAARGMGREEIRRAMGMSWYTLEQAMDKHGIAYRRNHRSVDQVDDVAARYGGVDKFVHALREYRRQGVGWQRLAAQVGLNRYACRVLVEEGRVPGMRS